MIPERFDLMKCWVLEREAARLRKDSGAPPPWTDDPVIRDWRFCNVRREDDRVTRWIKENVRERFAGHQKLWFMLCAARMINWPETLEALIDEGGIYQDCWPDWPDFTPSAMGDALEEMNAFGLKVFTGAYIVPAPTVKGETKGRYIAETVLGQLWRHPDVIEDAFRRGVATLESTHRWLTCHRSWGPFLAYQAVVDMRFTPLLENAADVRTWCACGPGTIRGLNRLFGRNLDAKPDADRLRKEALALWPRLVGETGVEMDLSDVPNVCCEFDKYSRVLNGEGAPRARYVPGRGA